MTSIRVPDGACAVPAGYCYACGSHPRDRAAVSREPTAETIAWLYVYRHPEPGVCRHLDARPADPAQLIVQALWHVLQEDLQLGRKPDGSKALLNPVLAARVRDRVADTLSVYVKDGLS